MLYREMGKTGDLISILGYGCMRFPQKLGRIDEKRAENQVIRAIERGVNYFDTAYTYHGGRSESVLGQILSKGCRDKVRIATKLPPHLVHEKDDMERILETQLRRLHTDHIDYYLIHGLQDVNGWKRLKQLGVEEFFHKAVSSGKLVRIGFSYHGSCSEFKTLLGEFPWDFCQIQYNYLDEHNQAGREGLEHAFSRGVGVSVMEPLRGGYLAKRIPAEVRQVWKTATITRTPAEWALRWVWDHPQVTTVLSGMNEERQIEENIRTAEHAFPLSLSGEELALYDKVKGIFRNRTRVECTGCGYCMPCPVGVDIPLCFSCYNQKSLFGDPRLKYKYMVVSSGILNGRPSHASLCRDCGSCEKACPQHLPIRRHLGEAALELEGAIMKPASLLGRKIRQGGK